MRYTDYMIEFRAYTRYVLYKHRLPKNKFVIYGEGRNGSSLLVDLLSSQPHIKCDNELLWKPKLLPIYFVESQATKHPLNAYGFKLLFYQIKDIQKISSPVDFLNRLCDRGYRLIYISRNNIFRQALSNVYARNINKFHNRSADSRERPKIQINPQDVIEWIRLTLYSRKTEEKWLEELDHPYLHIIYEDDLEDSTFHQTTINSICNYLDISAAKINTDLKKMTSKKLSDFIINHEELLAEIKDQGYAEYVKGELDR